MKPMKDERYLCVSAYVRALESQLLSGGDFTRMIDADSVEDALRVLTDRGYPPTAPTMAALEANLRQAREETLCSLGGLLPDATILDLFRVQYDYHNIKVALKAAWTGQDARHLLMGGGRLDPAGLYHIIETGEEDQLPDPLPAAIRAARETVASTGDPQKGDFILDRSCFAERQAMTAASGSEFLQQYTRLLTDVANLQSLIRILRMGKAAVLLEDALFPGGQLDPEVLIACNGSAEVAELYQAGPLEEAADKGIRSLSSGSMTAFEKACDDAVLCFLQKTILIPFGLEPVLAYLAAREQEQRNIRIIISGRLAGLTPDTIRERMREAYV